MDTLLGFLKGAGVLLCVLLVFNFVILIHEWGHFLAARWRGLEIEKFQIWMGKPIWSRKWNGVQYGLGWLPIGGFVQLPQMSPMEAIEGKTAGKREAMAPIKPIDKIIVAFAGPLFSFLLALAFATVVSLIGKPESAIERTRVIGFLPKDNPGARSGLLQPGDELLEIDGKEIKQFFGMKDSVVSAVAFARTDDLKVKFKRGAEIKDVVIHAPVEANAESKEYESHSWFRKIFERPPLRKIGIAPAYHVIVKSCLDHSPAAALGLQKGDVITAVNGSPAYSAAMALQTAEAESKEEPHSEKNPKTIALTVKRGLQTLELTLTPKMPEEPGYVKHPITGVEFEVPDQSFEFKLKGDNPLSICIGFLKNSFETLAALVSPGSAIKPGHMSGPVGIVNVYYNLFNHPHWFHMIVWFSVMLNCGLALFNLFPIPVLDGGHITMALYEMIRGRHLPLKVLEFVQIACVMLLMSFMLFVTLKDVGGMSDGESTKPPKFKAPTGAASTTLSSP